jgi:hypothetical protein
LERWVLNWARIIEDHHHAITGIAFKRAVYLMMISPMAAW